MERKTCCIIGYLDIPADNRDAVWRELEREVEAALDDGYKTFITEFTEGVGMMFARHYGEWREQYTGVFWETILSRLDQDDAFTKEQWELLRKCDGIKQLCEDCRKEYPLSVTRYMVESSNRVITLRCSPDDRDTLYAMDYARTMGRELRSIEIY